MDLVGSGLNCSSSRPWLETIFSTRVWVGATFMERNDSPALASI
jgi:hypothetical protein